METLKDELLWCMPPHVCSGVRNRPLLRMPAADKPVKELILTQILSTTRFIKETEALQPQTIIPPLVPFAFKNLHCD